MKSRTIRLMAIMAAAIMLASCGGEKKEAETNAAEQKVIVKTAQVFERQVPQMANFTATIQPEVKNNIAPTTPGRIRRIMVDVGSRVSKGQRLVQMDAVSLDNLETQIKTLQDNYNRLEELYEVGGVSKQDLDNLKSQLDQALISKKNLQENIYLLSPVNGVVTAKFYDNGDLFNGQTPILTVMQVNPLKVVVNVSESYFSKVKLGMDVDISIDAFNNERFVGKVSKVYPVVDEMTRTFGVEIRLNNADNRVRPGMYARVKINFGTENRVVVPDQAVVKQVGSGSRFVYVYNEGVVEFVEVELGQRLEGEYELLSGVSSGSQVVVAGQARLTDGAAVEVVNE